MKPMNKQKMQKQIEKALRDPEVKEKMLVMFNSFPKLGENIDILENHMITVQKNQLEFEKYLQEILKKIEKLHGAK